MVMLSVNPLTVVLAFPAFLVALWVFQLIYFSFKLRGSQGVRAPLLVKTPFGGEYATVPLTYNY